MHTLQIRRTRIRITLTGLVVLAELLHLAWEYTHGGVISHHFLNRADLPAITNGWGIILLPALTWFLLGRIEKRILSTVEDLGRERKLPVGIIAGFVGSLLYGISLAVAFTQQAETIAAYLFLGMFLAALMRPVYRPEYLLGFILGMTFTFGAVLPTIIASLIAAVSAVLHWLVRHGSRLISLRLPWRRTALGGQK